MTPPDSELIARTLARDDRSAFGELVLRHQSAVRRFLRHLARGDAALADDLAQETFIRAYRGLARFRGDSSFCSWLLGIAHNQFRNAWRRRSREEGEPVDAEADPAPPPSHTVEIREDVNAAMKKLDPDEQTALRLFYHQGLTHPEISAALGWPLGTVKSHIFRGKQKLRALLQP